MAIATGTKAPDFTLKSKNDEGLADVTLSANYGSSATVLLFFPLAFTSVCESELCGIRDSLSEYNDLDAKVYGISVDSPFAQEAFAKANGLNFPLLSDFNKEVSTAYDVLFEDLIGLKGVSKRAAFVISKDGEVIYSESSDDPKQLPDFGAIKAALA
ncbi:redoxin domain-containing protein [Pelagicoccus sp. SDUM812005]|uniref:redoxin domain-containing protein n=1 Tax=Pelagicoccus sp. SDUM812005 TaxID=3041257 RepID=UPI00280E8F64|nr:redoxin domain-containing protein [Pelagicoccus sp. SDUM812005]MDQ8181194.1 redoxin domain-containing protein [Pelagicoccus sp. SDUM812005]